MSSKQVCAHIFRIGKNSGQRCDKSVSKVDPAGLHCSSHYKKEKAPVPAKRSKPIQIFPDHDDEPEDAQLPAGFGADEDDSDTGFAPPSPHSEMDADATLNLLMSELRMIAKMGDAQAMRKALNEIIAMA